MVGDLLGSPAEAHPVKDVYYNEIDKNACAWLAENMRRGLIPFGDIDDRSIELVQPGDVAGYVACHYFAGIGGWAYAARIARWPDERPIWTGSCPCQPFSRAGKRRGTADRRHLWPHLFRLISACRPPAIMGEQVAQAAGWNWFNGVSTDLAREAYQCRGVGLCSCAVDSPDERERIYWCAVADGSDSNAGRRKLQRPGESSSAHGKWPPGEFTGYHGSFGPMVDDASQRRGEGGPIPVFLRRRGTSSSPNAPDLTLGNSNGQGLSKREGIAIDARPEREAAERTDDPAERQQPMGNDDHHGKLEQEGSVAGSWGRPGDPDVRNGSWYADHEWIECHDGKKRRAQPGTSMLAARLPGRIPLWRGFGGSVNAQVAAEVIRAFMESQDCP